MDDRSTVNGLPLPPLLISMIAAGRWRHPGDEVVQATIPFLDGPVNFLEIEAMRRESRGIEMVTETPWGSALFHEARGTMSAAPLDLPWLDVEEAVFIAVNRIHGDDLGIALDYRTRPDDPRVVACEWLAPGSGCIWREVTGTFSEFVQRLGLGSDVSPPAGFPGAHDHGIEPDPR